MFYSKLTWLLVALICSLSISAQTPAGTNPKLDGWKKKRSNHWTTRLKRRRKW
ncbi:hypothetical protein [Paraflavitalea speifideaquila]|uniref:hypothetical protein n=1 Tax=Paraflavitalea speifideaquila TaxID=3076558 RepID=UPI0028EE80B4|nr:hypothetical protein [Paraflavitalea speifideiaquila]